MSSLNRLEDRLAILFRILVDGVDNAVSAAHLDCFEEALVLAHILKDICLQVAVDYEYRAPRHIFEGLLECLQDLLHGLEGSL